MHFRGNHQILISQGDNVKKSKSKKKEPEAKKESEAFVDEEEVAKKPKKKMEAAKKEPEYFELGRKRRAYIDNFKGNDLLHIREFYEDKEGNTKPGKSGIALNKQEWAALLEASKNHLKFP